MQRLLRRSLLIALTGIALHAQSDSDVMYDNPHVRVFTTTMRPHQPAPQQHHTRNRVWIFLDGGQMERTGPDGRVETIESKDGEVRWLPTMGPYVNENISNTAFQVIEIELKGKSQPQVELTDLDPLKVDSKHYKLVLENDHVRVVRVNFGPLENGVVHQHVRNYLVTYMNLQAKGDRGEVRLHLDEGTTTHTENNPLNRAVERIAVELK